MHSFVSETCKYATCLRPRIINEDNRAERSGRGPRRHPVRRFRPRLILENMAGRSRYNALMRQDLEHPIEVVGKDLPAACRGCRQGNVDA